MRLAGKGLRRLRRRYKQEEGKGEDRGDIRYIAYIRILATVKHDVGSSVDASRP